jgi:hypothetical protein
MKTMGWSKTWVEYLKWAIVLAVLAAPIVLMPLRQAQFVRQAGHASPARGVTTAELKQVELRAFAK